MKFYGQVGFTSQPDIEVRPGVFKPNIIERPYTGDVHRNSRSYSASSEQQNDRLESNNEISILSDLYAQQNWSSIRYVVWNGVKLKVTKVDLLNYPRITLYVGGIYNENETSAT